MSYLSKLALLLLAPATALPASAQVVERWVQRYSGPANQGEQPRGVVVDGHGNVIVTGKSNSVAAGLLRADWYTAKYAAVSGALLWEKRYNGQMFSDNVAKPLAVDSSGNVFVTGYRTVKYAAATGEVLWDRSNTPAGLEPILLGGAVVDSSGNVAAAGLWRKPEPTGCCDYFTVKYAAANGALLWEKPREGPVNSSAIPSAVTMDGSGNVIVTGYSTAGGGFNTDIYTAKYAAADGALLWERHYDGLLSFDDKAAGVAVDASGNVFVTGHSLMWGDDTNWYTAKYAAADGALLWETHFDGPDHTYDRPYAIAVDGSGNAVVTGISENETFSDFTSDSDMYTAKYAAADGVLLWEVRYSVLEHSSEQANAVAIDGGGNVVVAGWAAGPLPGTPYYTADFFTAKYDANGGGLLWQKLYNGPVNGGDLIYFPGQLALTPEGGAVVTGSSEDGRYFDYATVYYAPGTALQSWREDYFGTHANTGPAADNADPDHDGLPNLIEWGCGLDPTTSSPPPVSPAHVGTDFTIFYTRSTAAVTAGAVFAVEWSDTLTAADWHTSGVSEVALPGGGPGQRMRATLPSGAGRRYARLRVTGPPPE